MVRLTRINHKPIVINAELIEHLEVTPDTVVTMMGGQKFVVLEGAEEVVARVVAYRRSVLSGVGLPCGPWGKGAQVEEAGGERGETATHG
ncbi:MAG: flagellar FlbD family protein [Bryobacteraceae bacterium]